MLLSESDSLIHFYIDIKMLKLKKKAIDAWQSYTFPSTIRLLIAILNFTYNLDCSGSYRL